MASRSIDASTRTQRPIGRPAGVIGSLVIAFTVLACGGGGSGDGGADAGADGDAGSGDVSAPDVGPLPDPPPACPSPSQAHIPQGDGTTLCTRVGALEAPAPGEWPDPGGLPSPAVYVRPGAAPGGNGSMDMPFGTIGDALGAMPAPAAIVLARGTHTLAATATISTTLEIRGVGSAAASAGTTITGPAGAGALLVQGAGASVTVRGVRVVAAAMCAMGDTSVGLDVAMGATVTVRDVLVDGYATGVRATGASINGSDLTARHACSFGILLHTAARGDLTSVVARDGAGVGILSSDSRLALDRALVADNGSIGLGISGSLGVGMADTISHVEITRNTTTGLAVQHSGASQANVTANLIAVYATRAGSGAFGDGVQVGPGGDLVLDPALHTDADRGHGSDIRGNARAGVLVTGDPANPTAPVGRLTLTGGTVSDNAATGIFLQQGAVAPLIGYTIVGGNNALGVAVTSRASLVQFLCNAVHSTRPAQLMAGAIRLMTADGLSMSEGTGSTMIAGTDFSTNGRFGLVLQGSGASLTDCHGSNNLYGVGAYGGASLTGDTTTITGLAPPPPSASVATGF